MIEQFILGAPIEYAFGQTVAMGNGATMQFLFDERLGAVALLISVPIIAVILWQKMRVVSGK